MNIIIIAAIGRNNEIGTNGHLIWRLKGDMKFFKEQTIGHTLVMGRSTFESLPKLLPNRKHIVITRKIIDNDSNVITYSSIEKAINYIKTLTDDVYVIGGENIYKAFLNYADILYITKINATSEATSYFPSIDENLYDIEIIKNGEENGITYCFKKYTKRGAR